MTLSPGARLGRYAVTSLIGKGGMGEVFRARDTELDREVAIKVLPQALADDADRLARFEREARLLASLNHNGIATLFSVERSGDTRLLVMELVSGETLAAMLGRAPLSACDCLPIFDQIADALEAAHERGVVHRDLKPANVMVTSAGRVKVLDFGLAKMRPSAQLPGDASERATERLDPTEAGVVVGTTAYMSPEQARGRVLDRRTDVWSFGCMFYEALVGQPPFSGSTAQDTLAAIIEREPDWSRLPPDTPPRIQGLLRRCLQKDPARRQRDMGDIRLEIDEAATEPATTIARAAQSRRIVTVLGAALAAAAVLAGLAWLRSPPAAPLAATVPIRFAVEVPPGVIPALSSSFQQNAGVALAPQGTHLAYSARAANGQSQIYLQSLDRLAPQRLAGTEGGFSPFFSPDGRWIGYFTDDKLKKVSIDGGSPLTLVSIPPVSRGGSWAPDDSIVLAPTYSTGLFISRNGVDGITEIARPDAAKQQFAFLWPQVLPGGGGALLYTVWTGSSFDDAHIAVRRTGSENARTVVTAGTHARYVPSGHIVFARGRSLLAVPFDLGRLEIAGTPIPVVEDVLTSEATGAASFDVSANGTLAYIPATSWTNRSLLWVDEAGRQTPATSLTREFLNPRLSPDGRQIAVQIVNDLWIYDIDRDDLRRLTFEGISEYPVWSPDGSRIAYTMAKSGDPAIYVRAADGSGKATRITREGVEFPGSWSPDGKVLAYSRAIGPAPSGHWDIFTVAADAGHPPTPLIEEPFNQVQATFSPNGAWIAYVSDESGQPEVYVRPYPRLGAKRKISNAGGAEPVWSRDSREIYYRVGEEVLVVAIGTPRAERPRRLFTAPVVRDSDIQPGFPSYDTRGGRTFITVGPNDTAHAPRHIVITLNWLDEIGRRFSASVSRRPDH